ncbi:MAG TPA: hypothetical protein PLD10_11710 [Rhodopila sp.]|nr:hypothetical protein [Rhodopila sp.]
MILLDEGDIAFRAAGGNFGLVWVQGKGAGMPPYAAWTRQFATLWPDLTTRLAATDRVDRIGAARRSFTVHTPDGSVTAPKLAIAAGLGSRVLAPLVGRDVAVSPQQGQIIVTGGQAPRLSHPPAAPDCRGYGHDG